VIQYDFDKEHEGWVEVRGCPIAPSASLLHAVDMLEAGRLGGVQPWKEELEAILAELRWKRPAAGKDILVDTTDKKTQVKHPKDPDRETNQPRVFYGPIGSANKLLKNPVKRDALREQHGVRAIEMEGSGIADATWAHESGYLVVRGICDYCDSNKGDAWQNYAAACAAAYTIALIRHMPGTDGGARQGGGPAGFPGDYTESDQDQLDYIFQVYERYGSHVRKARDGPSSVPYLHVEVQTPGLGINRALVTYLPKSAQSPDAIRAWVTAAHELARAGGCLRAVVVHDRDVGSASLSADVNVTMLQMSELDAQLLDVRPALSRFVTEYEQSDIHTSYIPLRAVVSFDELDNAAEPVDQIDSRLMEWFASGKITFASVLGDYGAGKSTLLNRLKYLYAHSYIRDQSRRKPLFIQLRDFNKFKSLESLLHDAFIRNFERELPLKVFWKGVAEGEFVILLDGFDEMTTRASRKQRQMLLHELSPLLRGDSPTLLSCRPAYFVSATEYNDLLGQLVAVTSPSLSQSDRAKEVAQVLNLLEEKLAKTYVFEKGADKLSLTSSRTVRLKALSAEQIDEYLKSRDADFKRAADCGWQAVKTFLESIYDLKDLMRRPIILRMITDTVLAGHINIRSRNVQYGPSALYRIYTNMELSRDWQKGKSRQLLTKEERTRFAVLLALTMLENMTFDVTHDQILGLISTLRISDRASSRIMRLEPDELATDVRTCAFLTTSGDLTYRFTHRSFMEYFVAFHLQQRLMAKKLPSQLLSKVPYEVLYFLGSFAISDPPTGVALRNALKRYVKTRASDRYLLRNLCTAVLFTGRSISGLNLDGINLEDSRHQQIHLEGLLMSDCKLHSVHLSSGSIRRSGLEKVLLEKCEWSELEVDDTSFEVELDHSVLRDIHFSRNIVSLTALSSAQLENARFTSVKSLSLKGAFQFWGGSARNTRIKILPKKSTAVDFFDSEFTDCSFSGVLPPTLVTVNKSKFSTCTFYGIAIGNAEVSKLSGLTDSRGFVFVFNLLNPESSNPARMWTSGHIVFIDLALLESDVSEVGRVTATVKTVAGDEAARRFQKVLSGASS
jgi:uncharacterized protein YjbI with pentapeptide repeats